MNHRPDRRDLTNDHLWAIDGEVHQLRQMLVGETHLLAKVDWRDQFWFFVVGIVVPIPIGILLTLWL